jgi:hypothetical protein
VILTGDQAEVVIIGNVENASNEFQIKNSAKAFKILSSGLYKNKLRAIVRELSCNALDSHVMAKKADVPFDLHLPTTLEPWFSIRDYGTSLDHAGILSLYSTYFSSSKTQSNDQIGAFGLGSKSPFSYTDNFTVAAYMDGKVRNYSAFINEQGVPSILLMTEADSDDAPGIEVKFPLTNDNDIRQIRDETCHALRHFKVLPNFTGADLKEVHIRSVYEAERSAVSPGVRFRKGQGGSVAIQGGVEYPLDPAGIDADLYRFLAYNPLVIEFAMGELDVAASREELSYDKKTLANITVRAQAIIADVSVYIAGKMKELTTDWEKILYLKKYMNDNYLGAAVKVAWVAAGLDSYFTYDRNGTSGCYSHTSSRPVYLDSFPKGMTFAEYASGYKGLRRESPQRDYDHSRQTKGLPDRFYHNIGFSESTVFVICDDARSYLQRMRLYFAGKPKDIVVVGFEHNKKAKIDFSASLDKYVALIAKEFGNPTFIKVSDMPEAPKKEKVESNHTVAYSRNPNYSDYRGSGKRWLWDSDRSGNYQFDDTTIYYYVEVSGYEVKTPEGSVAEHAMAAFRNFEKVMDFVSSSGIASRIYGVRKAGLEGVKSAKNWKNIFDAIAEKADQTTEAHARQTLLASAVLAERQIKSFVLGVRKLGITFSNNSAAGALIEHLGDVKLGQDSDIEKLKTQTSMLKSIAAFSAKLTIDKYEHEAYNSVTEFYKQYPMIKLMSDRNYWSDNDLREDMTVAAEYINAVDSNLIVHSN